MFASHLWGWNSNVGSSRVASFKTTVEVELLRSCNVVHGDISGSNCCMDDARVARLVEAWIHWYSFEPIGSWGLCHLVHTFSLTRPFFVTTLLNSFSLGLLPASPWFFAVLLLLKVWFTWDDWTVLLHFKGIHLYSEILEAQYDSDGGLWKCCACGTRACGQWQTWEIAFQRLHLVSQDIRNGDAVYYIFVECFYDKTLRSF